MPARPARLSWRTLSAIAAATGWLSAQVGAQPSARPAAPLRLVGHFPGRLEHIRPRADGTAVLTVLVGPLRQAIDRGDRLLVSDPATGRQLGAGTVALDTRAEPDSGRVHVSVRFDDADTATLLTGLAPARHRVFPTAAAERDAFVRAHGPKVTIVAPHEPGRGDLLADFVQIARDRAAPVTDHTRVPPQCSFTLRFDQPVDPSTLRCVELRATDGAGPGAVVPVRILAVDSSNTVFRFEPPMGLPFLPAMRAAPGGPARASEPQYLLHIGAGRGGLRSIGGHVLEAPLHLPITLDPASPLNLVGYHVYR